ncbi:MAG: FAD-dependent oxidoreductase [Desulfobacteraceae bacterium]
MEKKVGFYVCKGCEIGQSLDIEGLLKVAKKDGKVPICKECDVLCSPEGIKFLQDEITNEEVNTLVIAACSPRVKYEEFDFPGCLIERVNLRELVVWSHEPNHEETQALAEDYVRMACARAKRAEIPEPYASDPIDRTVMVIGGGITGLSAALEVADLGYSVVLVEKEAELGGYGAKLYRQSPRNYPYRVPEEPVVFSKIKEVQAHPKIKVMTSSEVESTEGQPGLYDVVIKSNGNLETMKIGAIVLAAGWKPYDPNKLDHLGYGLSPDVITSIQMEELAHKGKILRPSDGREAKRVAFIQCAGSRDPDHLPYCSAFCCMSSLKQAHYVRELNDGLAYIIYRDIRTPGQYELFYKSMQDDPGVMLTKGDVTGVSLGEGGNLYVHAENTLLGEKVKFEADLVVLATGIVPTTLDDPVTNLTYRQGLGLPDLDLYDGFADSNFICFQYETRRTGIYAAGCVRQPMDMATCMEDAAGAALKAVQCLEHTAKGISVHPRAWDMTFPDPFMQRCTQCKRCTEECPFGAIDEDEKGTPYFKINRCRRCGTCMGACPERIISFKDQSVDIVGSMIKAMDVPEEGFRLIGLVCENDAYPALDAVGIHRLKFDPRIRFIPIRCLGSFNLVWIADALSRGFDGVMLLGCKFGEDYQCHFAKGSELANERMGKLQETLDRLMLEAERAQFIEVAIDDFDRIPGIIERFMARIEEIGENPFKEF